MSRPHASRAELLGGVAQFIGTSASWIAPCIFLSLTGCYFGEIEVLPLDQPPELKDSNHVNGDTILIERENQFIFIQISDEAPALLSYTWSLSHDGFIGDAESFPDGRSQVRLSNTTPGLDGQTLKCLVSDGTFDLLVSWPLEVLP